MNAFAHYFTVNRLSVPSHSLVVLIFYSLHKFFFFSHYSSKRNRKKNISWSFMRNCANGFTFVNSVYPQKYQVNPSGKWNINIVIFILYLRKVNFRDINNMSLISYTILSYEIPSLLLFYLFILFL